jgi:hypothetical protein
MHTTHLQFSEASLVAKASASNWMGGAYLPEENINGWCHA